MSKHHGTETLTFEGLSGYYGSVPEGYGGFIWSDAAYLNASYWENVKTNWCDTGYQNVVDGSGLAFTQAPSGEQSYGYLRSENLKQTFSLESMVAASAWETKQPFKFTSYTYEQGVGFVKKASFTVDLSQTAQKIDFSHLPTPTAMTGAFDNISALIIKSSTGAYGNTCSYGAGQYTTGNQLAFDDLTVKWSGGAPKGMGRQPAHPLLANQHHHITPAAHLVNLHATQAHAAEGGSAGLHHASADYHAELLSLPGHGASGLTAQFQLPDIDHFGS